MQADWRLGGIGVLVIGITIVLLVVWPNYRRASFSYAAEYPDKQLAFGGRYIDRQTLMYSVVSAPTRDWETLDEHCPLVVRISGRPFHVYELTPDVLRDIGCKSERDQYGRVIWSVTWSVNNTPTSQMSVFFNGDKVVKFAFDVGSVRPYTFEQNLPVALSIGHDESLRFPMAHAELDQVLGKPAAVTRRYLPPSP